MSRSAGISSERYLEILGVVVLAISLLLFLALTTDGYRGDIHRPLDGMSQVSNLLGKPGAMVSGALTLVLGRSAHIIYAVLLIWSIMLLRHEPLDRFLSRLLGMFVLLVSTAGLVDINTPYLFGEASEPQGGVVGDFAASVLENWVGFSGAEVVLGAFFLVGLLLVTDLLFLDVVLLLSRVFPRIARACFSAAVVLGRGIRRAGEAMGDVLGTRRAKQRRALRLHRRLAEQTEVAEEVSGEAEAEALFGKGDFVESSQKQERQESLFSEDEILEEENTESASVSEIEEDESSAVVSESGQSDIEEVSAEEPQEPVPATVAAQSGDGEQKSRRGRGTFLRRRGELDDALPPDYVYPKKYTKPPLTLFDPPPPPAVDDINERLAKLSALLEEKLKTFGVEARVTAVTRGPAITRFELEPAPGVKVSRFVTLSNDIALALKAHRVRVEAPIPGKGRVGIEVPNAHREPVVIRDLLESKVFQNDKGHLKLALGKDIAGDVVTVDLASMPHLLVAGATGSGKTVCVKTMIASLLCSKTPEELQLMLIDPKMVELSIFDDIPHLITPVVTDPKKAATALRWLIVEMEERFRLFTDLRVRNIEVYNRIVENGEIEVAQADGAAGDSVEAIRRLPYIVCIIDELADLMILARAEVEDAIARLAQLARAVGIHLILATQRPSVDVLTGVIKANFPARLSFQVSSRVDSRCILDEIGAEDLIGRGDMLYLAPGQSKPLRIQGAFVSDEEMNRLIAYLKTQAPPQYRDEIRRFGSTTSVLDEQEDDRDDELLDKAIQVVLETGQASISMVQRRLRVGYTRAARLIDMMEMRGIVGPHVGSKAREILVPLPSKDEVA